jgi:fructokinase
MTTRKQHIIVGLGEILWDIYGEEKFLGGAPANFAVHVQQAGQLGLVLSRVGQDKLGEELRLHLKEMQLQPAFLQADPNNPTGTVLVTLDRSGVPSFKCTKDVAFDHLEFDSNWQELAPKVDAVLFGTLAQRNEQSHQTIHEFLNAAVKAIKIYDINLRGWNARTHEIVESSLQKADVIKLNKEELETLGNVFPNIDNSNLIPHLLERFNLNLAAVTLGQGGAMVWSVKEGRHYSPGFRVNTVDTTGSGDAFAAGLVIKMLDNASIQELAEFANLLGAFVATQKGAVPKWNNAELNQIRLHSERVEVDLKYNTLWFLNSDFTPHN